MKNLLSTLVFAIFGILVGFAAVKSYGYFTTPKIVVEGDFQSYFKNSKTNVILYTLKGCTACTKSKKLLDELNIQFEEREANNNKTWLEDIKTLNNNSVPVLLTRQSKTTAYHRETMKNVLYSVSQ